MSFRERSHYLILARSGKILSSPHGLDDTMGMEEFIPSRYRWKPWLPTNLFLKPVWREKTDGRGLKSRLPIWKCWSKRAGLQYFPLVFGWNRAITAIMYSVLLSHPFPIPLGKESKFSCAFFVCSHWCLGVLRLCCTQSGIYKRQKENSGNSLHLLFP